MPSDQLIATNLPWYLEPARTCRYVRLQQNGSGVVGIDSFAPLGTTTFYNDINQIITSWDVFLNIG